jgi:hypothetical protein
MNAYYKSISKGRKQKDDTYNNSIPTLPKLKNYNPNYGTATSTVPHGLNRNIGESKFLL